jgi:hypothetical protein
VSHAYAHEVDIHKTLSATSEYVLLLHKQRHKQERKDTLSECMQVSLRMSLQHVFILHYCTSQTQAGKEGRAK